MRDVASDAQEGGLRAMVRVDRDMAGRLGISMQSVNDALNDAFGQRQVSTIYAQANQYRVVLEALPQYQNDPASLGRIYVPSSSGVQVPLNSVAKFERITAPLAIQHQEQFPSTTISFNLGSGAALGDAVEAMARAQTTIGMPGSITGSYSGDAAEFSKSLANQPWLILAAVVTIYIVLGVLYESYVHPFTILTTLPSAGIGAVLALMLARLDLSLIALIGIILLMGIVKKNAILMIDFALDAERERGLSPHDSIVEACRLRFRPIMMTTLAALFGAIPLAVENGTGSELRYPLGVTIIGGLLLSQVLTLYTTPVIYLAMERIRARLAARTAGNARSGRTCACGCPTSSRGGVRRSHELLPHLHRAPHRHHAHRRRPLPGRHCRLSSPSHRQLTELCDPDDHRFRQSPRCRPRNHGRDRRSPPRTPPRRNPRRHRTHIFELASARRASPSSSTRAARSIAPPATSRLPSTQPLTDLPGDLAAVPTFRKANPAAAPIMIIALTSKTMPASAIYDVADTVIAQRLDQVEGVAEVNVSGAEQPAIRVRANPSQLAAMSINMEDLRLAITNANTVTPLGAIEGSRELIALDTNAQLRSVEDYRSIIVKSADGRIVRIGDVATVEQATRNARSAAMFNMQPAVLLFITKQPDANVIETVDRIKSLIPELQALDSRRHRFFGSLATAR